MKVNYKLFEKNCIIQRRVNTKNTFYILRFFLYIEGECYATLGDRQTRKSKWESKIFNIFYYFLKEKVA